MKQNQLDLYNKSRVRGDFQARFCERLGVKFPLSTRCVPRINHGNKRLNAVIKMMVGPSESLYRRWF